jgi:hypothetical protein
VKGLERLSPEMLGEIGEDAGDVSRMETIEDVERVDVGATSDELPHSLGEQRSRVSGMARTYGNRDLSFLDS